MKALRNSPLPKPSEFGHYWLGARPTGGAVIFKASAYGTNKRNNGRFFASRGVAGGVLFQDGYICYFSTPEEAHQALLAAGWEEGGHKS